ncbi:hypothetical protein GGTG_10562 [Gaeumannomyces tritici R3-111a-1]|uniref:Ecp2 effector protein domain-containing protein n=1 Tax=Gaeumannomyces tritici (strain R3-111a-1) TaxID=644352 RepID=J3PAN7_GAET3|nr:hypothetical protein GGTG_10562 [Gaeumannomyces tritici R3-111a-1]EJT71303.1 hypothetical protein GGTG_10562 [Gaeumannomyces tritici R3-111a-1]
MRSAVLASVLLVGLSHALVVPDNLADGVWAFALDAGGDAVGAPVPVTALPAAVSRRLAARQQNPPALASPQVQCKAGYVNVAEFATARAAFNDLCDRAQSYPANVGIVVAQGSALAYMCNYDGSNRCWRQEYDEASLLVDGRCGSGRVGTVRVQRWNKSYGRANRGESIC